MENNVRHPNKKLSSIHTASIIVNESDYSEINDKTPIETLGISMSKDINGKKKKLEFDIPKSKEGNGIKKRINTEGEDAKALDSLANSIGNIIDKKEFKLGERTNLLLRKNSDEKKTEEKKEKGNKKPSHIQDFYHTVYVFNCKIQLILSIISVISSIVEYENTVIRAEEDSLHYLHVYDIKDDLREYYHLSKKYIDSSRKTGKFCSYLSFICSIFLWISIYLDEVIFYQLVNNHNVKNYKIIIESKKKFFSFLWNIIIFFLAPMPMTYGINCHFHSEKFDMNYNVPLNSIFTAFCLIRLWFVVKYYLATSNYYNQRAFRAFKIYGLEISLGFPFKSTMLLHPLSIDLILFLIFLFLCSYNLRIFERYTDEVSGVEFGHFYNDLWCIFITMTTVGYGDLAPTTEFGRIFVLISCLFGTFLVALAVSSVSNCLLLENNEFTIFQILEKAISIEGKNEAELMMVMRYIKILKKLKRGKANSKIESYQKNMALFLEKYKIAKDYYLETCASFNDFDELMNYLDYVENNVATMEEKINNIIGVFDKISPPSVKEEEKSSQISKSSSSSSSSSGTSQNFSPSKN
jgi:hypothetical protein